MASDELQVAIERIFAVVCVPDIGKGREWYTNFFGREPDQTFFVTIHEWYFGDGALQLMEDKERAGKSLHVYRSRFGSQPRGTQRKGLMLISSSTADFATVAQMEDLCGNVITFAQPTSAS